MHVVCYCRSTEPLSNCTVFYINTSDMGGSLSHTAVPHLLQGTCGSYVDEGRLDTDRQEHTLDGLQEGVNYSFTVNQTGFSGGRVLSTGPVYARTLTAGTMIASHINSVVSATILLFHWTNFIMWCFDCYLTIFTPD